MKFIKLVWVALPFLALMSCEKTSDFSGTENEQIRQYIAQKGLKIDDSTSSGFKLSFTKRNSAGSLPKTGQTVKLNYAGFLLSGKKFDSGDFSFKLNAGQVIQGFDLGVARVRVGEKATCIFPSTLGYGSQGSGNSIPGNSPLVFEIEVLSIQ
jgi:FKBP-type peptidyl-prolyl cis-trans isomerase